MHGTIASVGGRASVAGRIGGFAIVLAVSGFGCASRESPFVSQTDARIQIEVINHGFQDATLHAVWVGKRIRLGTVSGTRTANYTVPWPRGDLIRIEIRLLAGPACITREIWAEPGVTIVLDIQPRLRYCGM